MVMERRSSWLAWLVVAACALLLAPLLPAVMLALWLGALAGVMHRPLTRALGDRSRLAAAITLVALAIISLAADAYQLVTQVLQSQRGKEVLEQLASSNAPAEPGATSVWHLLLNQQERAWLILQQLAGTATRVVVGLVVVIAGTYAVLIDGARWYRWFEQHAPIPADLLGRLRDAFLETGRGLFIGVGGAGLLQAILATLAYLLLGVPHALELGLLTFCCSIIPSFGTALVWVPVAAGLALNDRMGAAIALAVCGVVLIGSIDNLAKPLLARRGSLQLPTYVVLVAMFAGVQVLGPWGLLVGPLVIRLAKAVLEWASPERA